MQEINFREGVQLMRSVSVSNIGIIFKSILLAIVVTTSLSAQNYTISGYLEDLSSSERLIGATIYDRVTGKNTVTNEYGFFSITLEAGAHTLVYSYVSYEKVIRDYSLDGDVSEEIKMKLSTELETIVITAEEQEIIQEKTQMSQVTVPIDQLKAMPVILGETDILKSLQLLPGVQSGGEGQTGVYVRGGSTDQNLILLDGVPVYNVSHVLGLFSVFNPDAVKNVTLTKGGFPARYGGRLSSIIDIRLKEGNMNEVEGEGSIGLISSKLTVQGPINKGKTSFLVSGRRTYADLIAKPFIKVDNGAEKPKFHFYDLNFKVQHKLSEGHRLYLSSYLGSDVFKFDDRGERYRDSGGSNWGNIISSLRWNWELSPKLFMNTTAIFSDYNIDIFAESERSYNGQDPESFSAKYTSGIRDLGLKVDLDYIPNTDHFIKTGASVIRHRYNPGAVAINEINITEILDTLLGQQATYSTEIDMYVEDDIRLGAVSANVGLHASFFLAENKNYASLQPRLGMNYRLNDKWSLKGSFATMAQYINLLTSESLSLPTDLWVPSTEKILPQQSWQAAIGAATTINDTYEFSAEAYYKKMDNVVSYKEGANFFVNLDESWEDKIVQGKGEAYGLELFLQRQKGRLTGWVGYTLSWNNRQFDDINDGKEFPFRYDRRHDFSIVGVYKYTDNITFSANWAYGTGNAVSLGTLNVPVDYDLSASRFDPENRVYSNLYGSQSSVAKNNYRMSSFHRLDMSVSFHKKKKKYERTWVIGLYNAYGNKNPFFILSEGIYSDFRPDGTREYLGTRFKEISLLRFVPSVSYNFKF